MSRPFESLLGNNCELRMLEYLLPLEGIEFNITELSEEIGVSRVTATRIVKKFIDWKILKSTRTAGNAAYYSINHESPIVKSIEQFNNVLVESILGDETLYEIHDYWVTQRPSSLAMSVAGDTHLWQELQQQKGIHPSWLPQTLFGWGDLREHADTLQREVSVQAPTRAGSSTENCVPAKYAPIQSPYGGI